MKQTKTLWGSHAHHFTCSSPIWCPHQPSISWSQDVTGQSGVNHQCPPLIFEVSRKSTVISPPQSLFLSAWLQEHLFLSAVRIWDVRENQCTIDWLVVQTMRNCLCLSAEWNLIYRLQKATIIHQCERFCKFVIVSHANTIPMNSWWRQQLIVTL